MHRIFFILILSLTLTACIGTKLTKRKTDTSQPYPSLHSVPDRPPKIDFKKADEELKTLEKDYAIKIQMNEELRKTDLPPIRPKT